MASVASRGGGSKEEEHLRAVIQEGSRCLTKVAEQQKYLNDIEMTVDTVFYALKDLRKIFDKERRRTDPTVDKMRREVQRLKSHTGPSIPRRCQKGVEIVEHAINTLNQHLTSVKTTVNTKTDHVLERLHDLERFSSAKHHPHPRVQHSEESVSKIPPLALDVESLDSESSEEEIASPTPPVTGMAEPFSKENGPDFHNENGERNGETTAKEEAKESVISGHVVNTAPSDMRENSHKEQDEAELQHPRYRSKFLTMAMERSRSTSPRRPQSSVSLPNSSRSRPPTVLGIPTRPMSWSSGFSKNDGESTMTWSVKSNTDTPTKIGNATICWGEEQSQLHSARATSSTSSEGVHGGDSKAQSAQLLRENQRNEQTTASLSELRNSTRFDEDGNKMAPVIASWKPQQEDKNRQLHRNSCPTLEFESLLNLNTDQPNENGEVTNGAPAQILKPNSVSGRTASGKETQKKATSLIMSNENDNLNESHTGKELRDTQAENNSRDNVNWVRGRHANKIVLLRSNTFDSGRQFDPEGPERLRRLGYLSPELTSVPVKEGSFIGSRIRNLLEMEAGQSRSLSSLGIPIRSPSSWADDDNEEKPKQGIPWTPRILPTTPRTTVIRKQDSPRKRAEGPIAVFHNSNPESILSDKILVGEVDTGHGQNLSSWTMQETTLKGGPLHGADDETQVQMVKAKVFTSSSNQEKTVQSVEPNSIQKRAPPPVKPKPNMTLYYAKMDSKMQVVNGGDNAQDQQRQSLSPVREERRVHHIPSPVFHAEPTQRHTRSVSVAEGMDRSYHRASPVPTNRKLSRLATRSRSLSPRKFPAMDRDAVVDSLYAKINTGAYLQDVGQPKSPESFRKEAVRRQRRSSTESPDCTTDVQQSVTVPVYRFSSSAMLADHKTPCCLHSVVVLETGMTVLVDKAHRRLQLLDANEKPVHELRTVDSPSGSCSMGKSRVAVAMPDQHSVRFYKVSSKQLRLLKDIKIDCDHGPVDVSFCKDTFYILCTAGHIHITDINGREESVLSVDVHGYLEINQTCDKFYVIHDGKVTCYDDEGHISWRKSEGNFTGMATFRDKLFVAERTTQKIMSLLSNGVCDKELVIDNIEAPSALAISPDGGKLVVTQFSDKMPKNKTRIVKVFTPYLA